MQLARGLTLIEILISIIILGLLFTLGLPAFTNYFANAKIRNLADEIQIGLQQAKFEAISRNSLVNFNLTGTNWTIIVPAIGNTPTSTLAVRTGQSKEANIQIMPNSATTGFNSQGRLSPTNATLSLLISSPISGACKSAGGNIRCLQIKVQTGGIITLCDPALPSSDPRGC